MLAKDKALQLVNTYTNYCYTNVFSFRLESNWNYAKKCALIAVNEIILANPHSNPFNTDVYPTMKYWEEVKKEIETLEIKN